MTTISENMVGKFNADREQLRFFDVNCWWDYTQDKTFHEIMNYAQVKSDLGRHYIHRAVITSQECLKSDPFQGNDRLAEMIRDDIDLFGSMVLVPEMTFSGRDVGVYIDRKIEQRFVCARMFPKRLRHSMSQWLVGDIMKHLSTRRIPLILWHNEVSWDYLEGLSRAYPRLPIIIEGNDVKLLYHNRNYVPLLQARENIYLETHNVVIFSELDYLANQVNKEKLLFGTYYPYNTPNATMLAVTEGRMPQSYKQLIASGNLERLIAAIQ